MDIEKSYFEVQAEDAAKKASGLLRSRYGLWALGAISFAESALVVPIVTDPFMVAYILANRTKVVSGVFVTVVASILGGVFAYAVAFWFFEFLSAQYLHGQFGQQFREIAAEFQRGTFIMAIIGAVTPVPYTTVALAAGFVKGNIFAFILGSILGRGVRFGVVGWLTHKYGHRALEIARRELFVATLVCAAVVAVYVFVTYVWM